MWESLTVSAAMIEFFFAGWPVSKVALGAERLCGPAFERESKPNGIAQMSHEGFEDQRRDHCRRGRLAELTRRLWPQYPFPVQSR